MVNDAGHLMSAPALTSLSLSMTFLALYPSFEDVELKLTPDLYHALTWPELSYVAVDPAGRIVGYILAKMYAYRRSLGPMF